MIPFFMVLLDKQLAKRIWILIRWDPSFSHGGQQAFNMAIVMEDLDKNYLWLTFVEPLLI